MNRNELNPFIAIIIDDIGGYEYEVYTKADVDDVLDDVDNENKALRHNLEDWKCENEALKARIKELEANQPKWISVKDKMPDVNEIVLVYWKPEYEGEVTISFAYFTGIYWRAHKKGFWGRSDVTHWQYIPEAPKSED